MRIRRRVYRILLHLEEEAAHDYVSAVTKGADPTTVPGLLRNALDLSRLREGFATGIRDEALASTWGRPGE